MSVNIDWFYHAKNYITAGLDFIAAEAVAVKDQTDARNVGSKRRGLSRSEQSHRGQGKKVVKFDMKKDQPDDATLLAHLIDDRQSAGAPSKARRSSRVQQRGVSGWVGALTCPYFRPGENLPA